VAPREREGGVKVAAPRRSAGRRHPDGCGCRDAERVEVMGEGGARADRSRLRRQRGAERGEIGRVVHDHAAKVRAAHIASNVLTWRSHSSNRVLFMSYRF
jgi:hypothetical protein